MIKISPKLAGLLSGMLNLQEGIQSFCNTFGPCLHIAKELAEQRVHVTTFTNNKDDLGWYTGTGRLSRLRVQEGDMELFAPSERFHLAFSIPQFELDFTADEKRAAKSVPLQDKMLFFKCSEGKEERRVASHLIALEQMLRAVWCGGYFAAVLPKQWQSREMRYMRWWQDNAALVARIKLPRSMISTEHKGTEVAAPGDWEFLMWSRPLNYSSETPQSNQLKHKLKYAEFRWTPFVFTLETQDRVEDMLRVFRLSDWYTKHVRLFHKMLHDNRGHMHIGTMDTSPRGLDPPGDTWFFEPNERNKALVQVVSTVEAIKKDPLGVQIKPTSSSVKLSPHGLPARGLLLDAMHHEGIEYNEKDNIYDFTLAGKLRRSPFPVLRDEITNIIRRHGLHPYMTESDAMRMKKQERWLDIQLTPIRRNVMIRSQAEESNQSSEAQDWEVLYEDSDMWAMYPDIMRQWEQRALAMNLQRYLYPFQVQDVIVEVAKSSVVNGNVMGLGKTRETLFAMLLAGTRHNLIVCPSKLIGVWQDEIQDTIVPYVRRNRRDWAGRILMADVNVIEWARDCLPDRLARFNIISYDKLKSIPRDGKFYKCPVCNTVVYSVDTNATILCPGDPSTEDELRRCSHRVKAWQQLCQAQGLSKRKVSLSTGKILPWPNPNNEPCEVFDDRPPRPVIPVCVPQEHMYKKTKKVLIGYEEGKYGDKIPKFRVIDKKGLHNKWCFANLIRWTFPRIAIDEALYVTNEDAQRTQAVNHLCGEHRTALTGTPIKGNPQTVLGILNWTFKRAVLPDYRSYDDRGESRFLQKYKTEVMVGATVLEDGTSIGGRPKQIPKINNPELFQAETAPLIVRHIRNEPQVIVSIPKKNLVDLALPAIPMDEQHRRYYARWQEVFAEWWQKKEEEEEGREAGKGELLTKITYLINASTIPHFMLEPILKGKDDEAKEWAKLIGKYRGPVTAKMLKCRELIREATQAGDKTIVFSTRKANLKLGKAWCDKAKLASMIVDGDVPLKIDPATNRSPRHTMVEEFRNREYSALWAGMLALAEGMNIPEASWGVIMDCTWKPADLRQAIGRMIRPQQTKTIHTAYLMHEGTIDEYMTALCYLKGRSADEGIDYMEFGDLTTELIPDIQQYADSIVDGTQSIMKQKMWLAVDFIRKNQEEEGE